uniref:N-acetylmuramate alpha-1-phosphate uridylyltransferase MurU n=1 Tax=Polynucleobacter sp. TaxID=2029855 RepID=UPI004047C661
MTDLSLIPCMVLAAGRGERMRSLTDHTPKPLLEVQGKKLIDWHIDGLSKNGFSQVVVNHAWLGEQVVAHVSQFKSAALSVQFSKEPTALETAGGLRQGMSLMKLNDYFFAINGDVFCPSFPFEKIQGIVQRLRDGHPITLAYLFLVENPDHNPQGDFQLDGSLVKDKDSQGSSLTFSGAGIYHQDLFKSIKIGEIAKLAPILRQAMNEGQVLGEALSVPWADVGTPERLTKLNK